MIIYMKSNFYIYCIFFLYEQNNPYILITQLSERQEWNAKHEESNKLV